MKPVEEAGLAALGKASGFEAREGNFMAIATLSDKAGDWSASGRLYFDEAPSKPIHIVAAAAVLGGAALDGYVLGIVGPALSI